MEIYFLIHKLTTYTNALGSLCFTAPYYNISVPNTIKRTLYWTVHMQWELAHNTYKYILLCSRLMSTHTQTERPQRQAESCGDQTFIRSTVWTSAAPKQVQHLPWTRHFLHRKVQRELILDRHLHEDHMGKSQTLQYVNNSFGNSWYARMMIKWQCNIFFGKHF